MRWIVRMARFLFVGSVALLWVRVVLWPSVALSNVVFSWDGLVNGLLLGLPILAIWLGLAFARQVGWRRIWFVLANAVLLYYGWLALNSSIFINNATTWVVGPVVYPVMHGWILLGVVFGAVSLTAPNTPDELPAVPPAKPLPPQDPAEFESQPGWDEAAARRDRRRP